MIHTTKKILHRPTNQPKAKFGFEAMDLKDFFLEVGRAMFGADWTDILPPISKSLERHDLNDQLNRCQQVVEHLSFALISRQVTAALLLNLPARAAIEELLEIDDDPTSHSPHPYSHYPILHSAWDGYWPSNMSDWPRSHMRVIIQHVLASDGNPYRPNKNHYGPLLRVRHDLGYPTNMLFTGPVVVLRADLALRALFPIRSIPADSLGSRHASTRNRLVDEVVAAAWRALAIHAPISEQVRPKTIIQYMRDYLDVQNIDGDENGLSPGLLQAIAGKLVDQLKQRNTTSHVILNSTPVRKK